MLQDKLPELIRSTYNFKMLVATNYKAKETLAGKGLTPSIFLQRFYRVKTKGASQIEYFSKERFSRPVPDFCPIDYDEYQYCRNQQKDAFTDDLEQQKISKDIYLELKQEQLNYHKKITKDVFENKESIEKFLNNQSFHWFQKVNKMFFHAMATSQHGFRVSTIDQPVGIIYLIELQKGKTHEELFNKVKKQSEILLKKIFELNPSQLKYIKPQVYLMYNIAEGGVYDDAREYIKILKNIYGIKQDNITHFAINEEQMHESVEWSHYSRPLLHFKYKLKSSDPVNLLSYEFFSKIEKFAGQHKISMKNNIERRLDQLMKKYEEANKLNNKFMSFFKGNSGPPEKKYSAQQIENRELADKMFILQDYKRAYDIYKSLASKLENRHIFIETNLSEMIQYCLAMAKYHDLKLKGDPYGSIEKFSVHIFPKYYSNNRLRHLKYLVFLTYVFHTFKTFNRQFIKTAFYSQIKNSFSSGLNIVSVLLYEQWANMSLLFPRTIDYRKYCYNLTRVASRYGEMKLQNYALRCLLIVENLYSDTFSNIEKYQSIQLCTINTQMKNFRESLAYLKRAWEIYETRIQAQDRNRDESQILKLIDSTIKLVREFEKNAPEELESVLEPNIRVPIVQSLTIHAADEVLRYDQKSGIKWEEIGNVFLNNKQLSSKGIPQKMLNNIFKSFDTGVAEEKYLIHSLKSQTLSDMVLQKNSRTAYVGEPIRISFYMRNPLKAEIQIDNVTLSFKKYTEIDVFIKRQQKIIKPFQSSKFTFIVTPKEPGFLQLDRIHWTFLKMPVQHKIKEPTEIKTKYKSVYFKLNIQPSIGYLEAQGSFDDFYYEGERSKMRLSLKNVGVQTIDKIYIGVAEEDIFGFRMKQVNANIEPNNDYNLELQISIPPILPHIQSGQEKKLIKILILYETEGKFRVARTINRFNIMRVAKLENFNLERLSTHLHLLTFTHVLENLRKQSAELQWMVIMEGYEIVKTEAAQLSKETNFFFFLKKTKCFQQPYNLKKSQFSSLQMYPSSLTESTLSQKQKSNKLELKFLWRKNNKYGCLSPQPISAQLNTYGYISTVYPINVKLQFEEQVFHDFQEKPFLALPIDIKLKNILKEEEFKVVIYLNESKDPAYISDATWEGICERKIKLQKTELKIDAKLIVIRPGIYDIANMINYTIISSKGKHINVGHNEYEHVYITVKSPQSMKETSKKGLTAQDFAQFDFFTQTKPIMQQIKVEDKDQQPKQYDSLI